MNNVVFYLEPQTENPAFPLDSKSLNASFNILQGSLTIYKLRFAMYKSNLSFSNCFKSSLSP